MARVSSRTSRCAATIRALVFSPDGRWLYISGEDADTVAVIDVAARKRLAQIKVGKRPRGIAFTPDARLAYVACEIESTVYAIEVASRKSRGDQGGTILERSCHDA